MIISGMRPYAGFYTYNSIKSGETVQQMQTTAQPQPNEQQMPEQASEKQAYTSFDYAKEYQPNASYELKGADSDLANLDMQKAISDMKKDGVLQQYQYFVGTQDFAVKRTPTETAVSMRSGEDFSL